MDFIKFTKALGALICGTFPIVLQAEEPVELHSAQLIHYVENPDGLATGFWTNYRYSGEVVSSFGPRPLERVNFHKWRQHEKATGEFDLEVFQWEQWAHLAGSTVITNINTFFTPRLNPKGMDSIPAHYEQDITNPVTREAARKFLQAFTRELLEETGTAWLVLDYELMWFALPTTQEIRQNYRDWFLESAALCREVAAEMSLSDRLKIGIIVNGDPFDMAERWLGSPVLNHKPQAWLTDCIAVSDFVGIDTYAGGRTNTVTPDPQLEVIRFWIQYYAGDKPIYVTESGFSTIEESGITHHGYHIHGTEAQQADFFEDMFNALINAHLHNAPYLSQLRGYLIWSYTDQTKQLKANNQSHNQFYGVTGADGSHKPAFAVVQHELDRIDSNPKLSASIPFGKTDILQSLREGKPVVIRREGGMDYDAIHLTLGLKNQTQSKLMIRAKLDKPVCLLARLSDGQWFSTHPSPSITPTLELPLGDGPAREELELLFTSAAYPMEASLESLTITASDG